MSCIWIDFSENFALTSSFNLRWVAQVQRYFHSVNINSPDAALCDENILHIIDNSNNKNGINNYWKS